MDWEDRLCTAPLHPVANTAAMGSSGMLAGHSRAGKTPPLLFHITEPPHGSWPTACLQAGERLCLGLNQSRGWWGGNPLHLWKGSSQSSACLCPPLNGFNFFKLSDLFCLPFFAVFFFFLGVGWGGWGELCVLSFSFLL